MRAVKKRMGVSQWISPICYALLGYALPLSALQYPMQLRFVIAMLCTAMICFAVLGFIYFAILCFTSLCFATLCYPLRCRDVLCYGMYFVSF